MRLSWRSIVVIVGLSFGLGVVTASHKTLLNQLGKATNAVPSLDLPTLGGKDDSQPSAQSSTVSAKRSSSSTSSSTSLSTLLPVDHTMPQRGDVRLVIISDLNGPYRSTTYSQAVINSVRTIPEWEPDLVLSAGDMVAGQLMSLTPDELQGLWQGFDRQIFQPIRQAGIPFAFALGQHDGSAIVQPEDRPKPQPLIGDLTSHIPPGEYIFSQERAAAQAYWTASDRDLGLEQRSSSADFPFRYSFVQNDIFFLVWEASTSELDETALDWAEQELSSAAAQQASMRISLGHFPLYAISKGRDRPSEYLSQGEAIRDLLETYDVHTHISGHHHAYYPGRVGDLELLYSGALGSGPRSLLGTDDLALRTLTVMDIFFDASQAPDVWSPEDDEDTTTASANPQPARNQQPAANPLDGIATVYTTYNMATMEVIEPTRLPRVVAGPTGLVLRQDMNRRDLSYEDNLRYVRSW